MMLNKNDFKVFNVFIFFWLTIGWLAFVLTLLGIFYWWTLVLFIAFTVAFGARFFLGPLMKISQTFIIVNLSLFIVVTAFSIYTTPTIFSGRDQGSISEAAIRLSQNNKLEFSNPVSQNFFDINSTPEKKMERCLEEQNITEKNPTSLNKKIGKFYCHASASGKALNFPGFFYTPEGNLVTQFPLVYISWLSFFYSFIGLAGFVVANAILFYIFLTSIFLLSCKLTRSKNKDKDRSFCISTITLAIIITSFSFSWFLKFTLTENMALALLWTGILQATHLTESKLNNLAKKKMNLIILLTSFGLLVFTRIEGIAFFAMMIITLLFHKNTTQYFRKNFLKIILPTIILLSVFFVWNLGADIYFYKAIAKSFAKDLSEGAASLDSNYAITTFNLIKIFTLYGIIIPLILGLFSVGYFFRKRDFQKLVPFFIIIPSFLYIVSPQITPDHPWMLRRFVFAILPASILYTSMLLSAFTNTKDKRKSIYYKIILVIVILLNIPAFLYFFTYSPGKNLLKETEKISQNFTEKDLILIDQQASGSGQEMLSAPMNFLFDKNAVYFFNPNDLKDLDTSGYDKIYLIIPEDKVNYYKESYLGNRMVFFNDYSIETSALREVSNGVFFPLRTASITEGSIFEIKK